MLVLLITFGVAWERDLPRSGLLQRLKVVLGLTWLAAVGLHVALTT